MKTKKGDFSADYRLVYLSSLALAIGSISAVVAVILVKTINFFTNLFFFQRLSLANVSPAHHSLGVLVIVVPVLGGLIIGFMARFGSERIRGH